MWWWTGHECHQTHIADVHCQSPKLSQPEISNIFALYCRAGTNVLKIDWNHFYKGKFITYRSFTAANNLTKFLTVATTHYRLIVRSSHATVSPCPYGGKIEPCAQQIGKYHGHTLLSKNLWNFNDIGIFIIEINLQSAVCSNFSKWRLFPNAWRTLDSNKKAQPTLSSGRAQPSRLLQHRGIS